MKSVESSSGGWRQLRSGGIGFLAGVAFLALCLYGMELRCRPTIVETHVENHVQSVHNEPTPPPHQPQPTSAPPPNTTTTPIPTHHIIMCMIFTTPEQWMAKALAVRLTWAKRCDFHKFFYSKSPEVRLDGAYALDVEEGRDHLTKKTMEALRISFNFYKGHVDWYVKADDDTFIIMENLRHILYQYDPLQPHYLGHRSKDLLLHGYNGGGASYSLSHQAAAIVVQDGGTKCAQDGYVEDLDMGRCLEGYGIYPLDLKDKHGRLRFHPDHPLKLLLGDHSAQEVYRYKKGNITLGAYNGIPVMSPSTVSFHYMEPGHMYMYDFLLYDLQRPLATNAQQGQG